MRLKEINELKGIAILLVVAYHIGGILGWKNQLHGEIGVDIFVVLSGLGLSFGYPSIPNKTQFLVKRFRKLLSPYWIILTLFALGQVYILHIGFDPKDFISHVVTIHSYVSDAYFAGYNHSFWYMSLITILYLVYLPVSRFVGAEKTNHVVTIGLSLTFILSIYYTVFHPSYGAFLHLVTRIPDFFFGIIYGMYLKNPEMKFKFDIPSALGTFVLLFLILDKGYAYYYSLIGVAFVLAYFQISKWMEQYKYINRVKSFFVFFGSISYEWYLIHQPLLTNYNVPVLTKILGSAPTPHMVKLGILAMLAITIVLAWLLKHAFEKNTIIAPTKQKSY